MIKDIRQHFIHYLILVLIIAIGGIGFLISPDKMIRFQVGALTSLAYVFWGIFHHLMENDLKLKIVVEYALIGLLATSLLGGILL